MDLMREYMGHSVAVKMARLRRGRTIRPLSFYSGLDMVKDSSLTWIEIMILVLYTGPMFVLYSGILRGFGDCGVVEEGVEFWSEDSKSLDQLRTRSVFGRMESAGHKFSLLFTVL